MGTNYVPLFPRMLVSSLWSEPPEVLKLFLTMLLLKDTDNVVRCGVQHLPGASKLTPQEVVDALKILESPDLSMGELSRGQPFEGRRIERTEDGWLILNGEKYQEEMRKINERARWARGQAARREREKKRAEKGIKPIPKEQASPEEKLEKEEAKDVLDRMLGRERDDEGNE